MRRIILSLVASMSLTMAATNEELEVENNNLKKQIAQMKSVPTKQQNDLSQVKKVSKPSIRKKLYLK